MSPRTCRREARCTTTSALGLRRHVGEDPSCALSEVPRASGPGGQPDRLRHRQPEREKRRKRGACIDPPAMMQARKSRARSDIFSSIPRACCCTPWFIRADIQDRDGGMLVLATLFGLYPFLQKLFADGGYQGPRVPQRIGHGVAAGSRQVEIVKRSDHRQRLRGPARRWVVERTFAWLNRCRDWRRISRMPHP